MKIKLDDNVIAQCFEVEHWLKKGIEKQDISAVEIAKMKAEYILEEINKVIELNK